MRSDRPRVPKGRGSSDNPPNRFERTRHEPDYEHLEGTEDSLEPLSRRTEYLPDSTQTIVTENLSPDISFRYSLNPYRGCSHGCSYCYARPTHEYLGLSAGLDFESKILVKHEAAKLFREFLSRPKWKPELIVLSGVTDPYQPGEREFRVTRQCLEVALEARQPIGIITKNALILRDLDLLGEMAARGLVHTAISITTLDAELARNMEPRTSTPAARLKAIAELSAAGVPVRAMVAPLVPGLNDSEIPAILTAVAEAGASGAGYTILRLPYAVRTIFLDWLQHHVPLRHDKVLGALRAVRAGKLTSSVFGQRMRGQGNRAQLISDLFALWTRKLNLDRPLPSYEFGDFRAPNSSHQQLKLF